MDRQPVLVGERLILRPLDRGDWQALYALAADPLVWAQHPMGDRWREPVFRAFFDDALAQGGALAVVDQASGAAIGSSRFQNHQPDARGIGWTGSVEIGWTFLGRAWWGRGVNAEMKQLMLAHAFRFVDRVVFRVGESNWRSRRAMEKIGGRLTGEVERLPTDHGKIVHVIYAIDRAPQG